MKLSEKILSFPSSCGVYWMKDAKEQVLYVGKAKNLKQRVKAYFQKESKSRYQIDFLMRRTADIDYLVTDTEKEALLLENTLIKKYQPRYNVCLKDDKSYASLRLNIGHPFPGFFVTRDIVKDGSVYFGPYASAGAMRQTLDLITRNFRLRTCSDHEFANRSRPCLEFHIGCCTAPCVGKVSAEKYATQVEEARLFLEGRKKELLTKLKTKMKAASREMKYEEAARARDLISQIGETLEKQKVVEHDGTNYDAVGFAIGSAQTVFCVLMVREGLLLDRQRFVSPISPLGRWEGEGEILAQFLLQYYGALQDIPREIFISQEPEDIANLREILSEKAGRVVRLAVPKKGERAKIVRLAVENAAKWARSKQQDVKTLLEHLQAKLALAQRPDMIECVDVSNLQGQEAVGSLVCFREGKPLKNRYRKFKIRLTSTPNDYAMMHEVLSRRFKRALIAETVEEKKKWALPDLLLVDGGKGQLSIALKVLADLGLHALAVAAIAKGKKGTDVSLRATARHPDKIYLPNRMNPVFFRSNDPELLYLVRIRDEAHRFGIAYHRTLRSKKMIKV